MKAKTKAIRSRRGRSSKRNGHGAANGASGRMFRRYLKQRSESLGKLVDLMEENPGPRLAGAENFMSMA